MTPLNQAVLDLKNKLAAMKQSEAITASQAKEVRRSFKTLLNLDKDLNSLSLQDRTEIARLMNTYPKEWRAED